MLKLKLTRKMKKDVKLMVAQGKDTSKLYEVLKMLVSEMRLPKKYFDHQLKGKMKRYRECHIEPDWLLVYEIKLDELILLALRTGSHTEIFDE